jgi:hypothetical protein
MTTWYTRDVNLLKPCDIHVLLIFNDHVIFTSFNLSLSYDTHVYMCDYSTFTVWQKCPIKCFWPRELHVLPPCFNHVANRFLRLWNTTANCELHHWWCHLPYVLHSIPSHYCIPHDRYFHVITSYRHRCITPWSSRSCVYLCHHFAILSYCTGSMAITVAFLISLFTGLFNTVGCLFVLPRSSSR